MHTSLVEAAAALSVEGGLSHLARSCSVSRAFADEAQGELRTAHDGDDFDVEAAPLDVVVFGSYARQEATTESDFDHLVIAHGLCADPRASRLLLRRADRLRDLPRRQALLTEAVLFASAEDGPKQVSPPGKTSLFGRVVSATDLVERIGLEQDTNRSQTVRMLLLEESESLLRDDLHEELLRNVLRRYLSDYDAPKQGPPRFLVNDVVRYWHTLTVDYAAKRYEQINPEWGLRYLKLIISRKLAYAGTLASLLSCGPEQPADEDYLFSQFRIPPLARLAQLHSALDAEEHRRALADCLTTADWFTGRLGDPSFREDVKSVRDRDSAVPAFQEAREQARLIQAALETLFFRTHLQSRSTTYLSF